MSLQKPDEDNMNPSHSETTQQSLEMKKERATRKQQKRVDIDAILNLMSKEIRGKLLIPNVHMDAIYIRSLFSGPDRALIGRNRHDDALQVVAYFSLPVRTIVKKKAWLFDCTSVEKNCASKEGAAALCSWIELASMLSQFRIVSVAAAIEFRTSCCSGRCCSVAGKTFSIANPASETFGRPTCQITHLTF